MVVPGAFPAARTREKLHALDQAVRDAWLRRSNAILHLLQLRYQLGNGGLVHLLLDGARITASRSTKRTEIDSKDSARNARRKGRALGHVPAVKGGASWYPRAPTGSPPRRDRDRQIPKPVLRADDMQEVL